MSVAGARMRMDLAIKDLRTKWAQVRDRWNDPVSHAFEENYLNRLDDAARIAGGALDKMRDTVARARRDCDDR
ncbi:MAG: hypothetical protein KF724_09480 [Phycisphaeraceae bacterium]|nr:hypothetical protein [Phycisphaeraceae bacterium]